MVTKIKYCCRILRRCHGEEPTDRSYTGSQQQLTRRTHVSGTGIQNSLYLKKMTYLRYNMTCICIYRTRNTDLR
jgi:hypothetical protein